MIRRIQARNFCCLRFADVSLDRFHVLVGPNASGKSTLLDVISFLGDMVSGGSTGQSKSAPRTSRTSYGDGRRKTWGLSLR